MINDIRRQPAAAVAIDRSDSRFQTLLRGDNLRFPATDAEAPDRILLCSNADEIAHALQRVIDAGMRPTVRSGGHCYEDFVANNPHGAILDLSLHTQVSVVSPNGPYTVASGARLGDVYQSLYKRAAVAVPAGTCYTVCAGGHFSGGGYGLLVRQRGLTVDWISSVDILTVDTHGKVVPRTVDRTHDPELFRACRGAGGGNFGVVTSFTFDRLPSSPREVAVVTLRFPWKNIDADALFGILSAFGQWLHTRGRSPETSGLAAVLTLGGKRANNSLNIDVQFTDERGEATDLSIVREFLQQFSAWTSVAEAEKQITRRAWLDATINGSDFGTTARAKYKSTYMKEPFTRHETDTLYRFLASPDIDNHGFVLEIDAYGGAANNAARIADTAIAQRASMMKLQWQCYWQDSKDDAARLNFMDDFYTAMYTGPHVPPQFQGTPMGGRYEGCYINYPDADMLRYSFWPELYYGSGGLYAHLQDVKRRYDPNNIFHSSMSIRPPHP